MLATMMLGCGAAQTHAQCFEDQKLTASDATQNDWFGWAVSVSGDTVVVGAQFGGGDSHRRGAAYVFRFDGTSWVEEQKLPASDAAEGAQFGHSVSVSGDTAIVGARSDDEGETNSGSAYIFRFDGTSWVEEQKLTASDAAEGDLFGISVSVNGDTAIVGAWWDDDAGQDSGSAYIFRFNGTSWVEEQKLRAADAAQFDQFGHSVSVSGDTAIVGAYRDDDAGPYTGSAYVFRFDGTSWVKEQKLTASDAATADSFGYSVSISGDTAIVGALGDDDAGSFTGSAYLFQFDGASWVEEQKLTASDAFTQDGFGVSVSVTGDTAIVGSRAGRGRAYVFRFNGTSWVEEQKLTAADAAYGNRFGYSVAVSGDTAVVGSHYDADGGTRSGSAYMFSCSPPLTIVNIDIKPGSCPNPVNRKSRGVIPVAIVGSLDFDVTTVDPHSLRLSRSDGVGESISVSTGPHGPWAHFDDVVSAVGDEPCLCHDFSGDGIDDLLLRFSASELTMAFGLDDFPQRQSIELLLEGKLDDGAVFEGIDCVKVLGAQRKTDPKRRNGAPRVLLALPSGEMPETTPVFRKPS